MNKNLGLTDKLKIEIQELADIGNDNSEDYKDGYLDALNNVMKVIRKLKL